MFMFGGAGPTGEELLCVVLEPDDMAKVFRGDPILAKPRRGSGPLPLFNAVALFATAQPKEVFIEHMRRTGAFAGITVMDRRAEQGPFSEAYEAGVNARRKFMGAALSNERELTNPFPTGPRRETWFAGWDAVEQQMKKADAMMDDPFHQGGWHARQSGGLRTGCPFPENDAGRLRWLAGWDAADAFINSQDKGGDHAG